MSLSKTKVEEQFDLAKMIAKEVEDLAEIFGLIIQDAPHSEILEINSVRYGKYTFHKDDEQMIMRLLGTVKGIKLIAYRHAAIVSYNRFIIDFIFDDIQVNPLNYKRLAPYFTSSLLNGNIKQD